MGLAILTASKSKIDKDEKKLNQIFLLLSTNVKLCISGVIPIMHVEPKLMLNKGGIPYFIGYKSIRMFEV